MISTRARNIQVPSQEPPPVFYPESDGQPMAENTEQFDWIVLIKLGLEWLFDDRQDIFVAGDLFWYPVEGDNKTRTAPDVMVVFGRPKGSRGCYLQWLEEGIPPQVIFEIVSPGNTIPELMRKFEFYDRFGVEEYYLFDPQRHDLSGWRRIDGKLVEIPVMHGWVSPRLGIRFDWQEGVLKLFGPDDQPFVSYVALARQWKQGEQRAEQERERAEQERQRAEQEGSEPSAWPPSYARWELSHKSSFSRLPPGRGPLSPASVVPCLWAEHRGPRSGKLYPAFGLPGVSKMHRCSSTWARPYHFGTATDCK
jgi:Uma2 family endonuclease